MFWKIGSIDPVRKVLDQNTAAKEPWIYILNCYIYYCIRYDKLHYDFKIFKIFQGYYFLLYFENQNVFWRKTQQSWRQKFTNSKPYILLLYTVGRIKEQIFQTKTWYFCFLFFVLFELTEPNWNHWLESLCM